MNEEKNNSEDYKKRIEEIEDALKMDPNSIEFESPIDSEWSPLDEPIKEDLYRICDNDRDILLKKIISWIFNIYDLPYLERQEEADRCCSYFTSITPIEDCKDEAFLQADIRAVENDSISFNTIYDIEEISVSQLQLLNHALLSIIKCIHNTPQTFVTFYADVKQLYFNNKEEEILCIKNLINDLSKFVDGDDLQLIPTPNLYITKTYDRFIVQDGDDLKDISNMSEHEKEDTMYYNVSKQTSDNFTKVLIRLLENRIALLTSKDLLIQDNEFDTRIDCKATKQQIRSYFVKLAIKDKNGDQNMSEQDVEHLLYANFKDFKPKRDIRKIITSLNQSNLRYFVYQFYLKYSTGTHEADTYANFLKNNFTKFDNVEIDTIKKNFSKKPAKFPEHLM